MYHNLNGLFTFGCIYEGILFDGPFKVVHCCRKKKVLLKRFNSRPSGGPSTTTAIEYVLVAAAIVFAFVTFIAILDPSLKRTFAGKWLGL
jgi:Flp pilus assembly pilin Flp